MTIPDNHLSNRTEVLDKSLIIEHLLSQFLAKLLNVPNWEESFSFRNNQGALTFDQKVGMLIDIAVLKKSDKDLFRLFMEVRNQFMHNLQASSYNAVFNKFVKDRKKKILSFCPELIIKTENEEQQLRFGFLAVASKVIALTVDISKEIQKKDTKDMVTQFHKYLSSELLVQISESTAGFVEPVIKGYERDKIDMPPNVVRQMLEDHNKMVVAAANKLAGLKLHLAFTEGKIDTKKEQ